MPSAATTIADARLLPDGESVLIEFKTVTVVAGDDFYIQGAYGSRGIRVSMPGNKVSTGDLVTVDGLVETTSSGERYIGAETVLSDGRAEVRPITMSSSSIGGEDFFFSPEYGSGQVGITGSHGLNTVGMLINYTGWLRYVDPAGAFIYVDDSGLLNDGNHLGDSGEGISGVRVNLIPGYRMPSLGSLIRISGAVSLTLANQARVPVLIPLQEGGIKTLSYNIPMLPISSGGFSMGNTGRGYDALWGLDREYPLHEVWVSAFFIAPEEVTRQQYQEFISSGGYADRSLWSDAGWAWKLSCNRTNPEFWDAEQWWGLSDDLNPAAPFVQTPDHPVVGVSYYEAEAFCNWAGGRLPTEQEWERAARSPVGDFVFPWGDVADPGASNDWYDKITPGYRTAPVGSYPAGISGWGCLDMSGNVWEWTSDGYRSYAGSPYPFDLSQEQRSIRGGGWFGVYGSRTACRLGMAPDQTRNYLGFRVAR